MTQIYSILTMLVAAMFAVAAPYVIQKLVENRKGSEKSVAQSLEQVPVGTWTFVAMQYYLGILNRTYLVFVSGNYICGAKVKGVVPAPEKPDDRWNDPFFYVSPRLAAEYATMNVNSSDFLRRSNANFQIDKREIFDIEFSSEPKEGMGTVPYSGRILLGLKNGKTVELILLGTQDGNAICSRLKAIDQAASH